MKVGILTMHRVINYGSFMQAYALKAVIESFGHSVEFRDFLPGEQRHKGEKASAVARRSRFTEIPAKLAKIGHVVQKKKFKADLEKVFAEVAWPLLGISAVKNYSLQADAIVIGSDEVFNYTQNHTFGYVPCLFGHGIEADILASYAASAGYASLDDIKNDGMLEELASGLRRFNHLSVRDENTRSFVEGCINRTVDRVIDPTLIFDFSGLLPASIDVRPGYVLVYAYEGRMDAPEEIRAVQSYARQHGLRTVSAGGFQPWCDENLVLEPFEVLKLFSDADYVVTDTFHGSIFAMKARRKFATLIRTHNQWGSNSNKVGFLLKQFGMESRIVQAPSALPSVLASEPPYEDFEDRLVDLQASSMRYLQKVLGSH